MNENELLGCEKHSKDCGVTLTDTGLGEFNCTCNYGVANGLSILIEMRSEQKCCSRESRIELGALDIKRELDTRTAPKSTEAEGDKERLDWLEKFFSGPYKNQHINYPAIPVRLNRHMPNWSIAQGFASLEVAIGCGDNLRQSIDAAISNEKGK